MNRGKQGAGMGRKTIIVLLVGLTLASLRAAEGQESVRVPKIGWLALGSALIATYVEIVFLASQERSAMAETRARLTAVDRLEITILVDNSIDIFLSSTEEVRRTHLPW